MLKGSSVRSWLVAWLYVIAFGHFVVAIGITWCADSPWFTSYHQDILTAFGFPLPMGAMELQLWWISLFGATLQAFALFMLMLVYLANRYRHAYIWLLLAGVMLLWAPQDMFISIQKNIWVHVWADVAAVAVLVPPLFALGWLDRKLVKE